MSDVSTGRRTAKKVRLGPGFRRLWTGATVSNLGDGLLIVAMPLLAEQLTRQHGSAGASAVLVTGIVTMRYAAWLLLGLLGGVVADRTDRQRVMVYVDLARTIAVGALGVTIVLGTPPIALLWITAFLLGCGEVFFDTSAEAMLPNVVEVDVLERANSRLYVTQSITVDLIGPPIGAFLFAVAASLPFLLDSWSFLASAMIVLTLRGSFRPKQQAGAESTPPAATAPGSVRGAIVEGWHYTRSHRLLRSLIVLGAAWNFFAVGSESTTVLFAKRGLHMSDAAFGLTWAGFAVGGVIAAWLTERIVDRFGPGHTILATFLLGGIAGTTAALSHNAIVFAFGFGCSFAAGTAASIVVVTLRQQLVPDALRGRVSAMFRVVIFASAGLGALVMGFLVQAVGLRAPLWALAAAGFALFLASMGEVNNRTIRAALEQATSQ
ncbi:MAG TPA: MFS transporter [Acidimicrobiia bacterium]